MIELVAVNVHRYNWPGLGQQFDNTFDNTFNNSTIHSTIRVMANKQGLPPLQKPHKGCRDKEEL